MAKTRIEHNTWLVRSVYYTDTSSWFNDDVSLCYEFFKCHNSNPYYITSDGYFIIGLF